MTVLVGFLALVFSAVFFKITAGLAGMFFGDLLPHNLLVLYRRLDWPGRIPRLNLKREVALALGAAVLVAIEWVTFEALTGDSSRLSRFDRMLFLTHMLLAAGWLGYLVSLVGQGAYEEEPVETRWPSRG